MSTLRASATNLPIQYARSSTGICKSAVSTGARTAASPLDTRAVAHSLQTRIPYAVELCLECKYISAAFPKRRLWAEQTETAPFSCLALY